MTTWSATTEMASLWPGVEETTWYRTPALKVAGKGFARLRTEAAGKLMVMCRPAVAQHPASLAAASTASTTAGPSSSTWSLWLAPGTAMTVNGPAAAWATAWLNWGGMTVSAVP